MRRSSQDQSFITFAVGCLFCLTGISVGSADLFQWRDGKPFSLGMVLTGVLIGCIGLALLFISYLHERRDRPVRRPSRLPPAIDRALDEGAIYHCRAAPRTGYGEHQMLDASPPTSANEIN